MEQIKTFFQSKVRENFVFRLLLMVVFFIPFQQRLYKFLKPLSLSLINPSWQLPPYFETHLDGFISDFALLFLLFYGFKTGMNFWKGEKKFLTLFLLFALGSILTSGHASYLVPYWRWMHLALPASLFFLVSRMEIEEDGFTKIAKVVLAASLMECAIAIVQYFAQHSIGLHGFGEPELITRHFLGPHFPMADGSVWIFDHLFHGAREHAFVLRATGTLPHPNILGGMMVFGLLMTYHLYHKNRGLLSLAILLQLFCLFITYSRSALYAWAAATALWIAYASWKEKRIHSLLWVVMGSFALCLGLLYPQLFERGGLVSYNTVTQSSDALRLTIQDVGAAMLRAHPFLGMGFNQYMLGFQAVVQGAMPATYIHNVYLHLAVEIGIPGVLALLVFCFFILKKGWTHRDHPGVWTNLCLFVAFLCIGLADFYPLCAQQTRLIFFLLAGLIASQKQTTALV